MVMGSLPEDVDLAVVGGGVGGYVAAIRAAQLGLNVTIVEKDKMGGHCLNYACIPSKTMIKVADIFYETQHSQKFGINVQGASINANEMLNWRMDVSAKLERGVEFLCKQNQIEIVKATATFLSSNTLQLTNGTSLDFKKALIATGSEPVVLKGFEFGGNVIDYKRALMLESIPKSMAIVGAGYVAVEIGTLYAKLGSKVSIIARSDVLSRFDRDAVELVKKKLQELGAKVYTNATPASHDASSVTLNSGEKIGAEVIVVAIGLVPYTGSLVLENTKVKLDKKGFVQVDSSMRTADPSILALGDVVGEPMLAHKAMRQGVIAGEVAAGQNSSYDNMVVPAVIFSDPEIAIAGVIEGEGISVTKFPLSALGRAIALDTTNGFVKIAYDKDQMVKGVEIVSDEASSMISEAALAIEMGATLEDIAATIHPHPTYSEAVMEAAEGALGMPIHFFVPKKSSE
ncbi:MAG: dihydrolipoyl dehydrogenase [Candidatus Micrarchaeota archaeon]|nr:dihydrolipoyl dehydrogenase [Candidatus Micrarchaeota archaeon]MDE1864983.1 dihydrolipoyl dehydrogenase [Candidatus Micrarchaeota archaeon]